MNAIKGDFSRLIDSDTLLPGGRIASDASSLILLNKAGVLSDYCSLKNLVTSELAAREVQKKDSAFFSRPDIAVKIIPTEDHYDHSEHRKAPRLSIADHSLVFLFENYGLQAILTDDGPLCAFCRSRAIVHINSPLAIVSLARNAIISKERFEKTLKEVYRIGRYSEEVRDFVKNLIKTLIY